MDLLETYLRTVGIGLPAHEREDITRELRENLLAQVADREAELRRPLDAAEMRALLSAVGHPLEVATRYRSDRPSVAFGRELIGPLLWPFYSRVIVIAVSLAAAGGLLGVLLDREAWSLAVAPGRIALPIALAFTIVTAVFTGIDRWIARHPVDWRPGLDLPFAGFGADRDGTPAARSPLLLRLGGVAELVVTIIGLGLWLTVGRPGTMGDLEAGPGWAQLWVPGLVAILVSGVAPLVAVVAPTRRRLAGWCRMGADFLVLTLAAWSLSLAGWLQPVAGITPGADDERLMGLINGGVAVALAIAIVVILFGVLREVRSLRRVAS